MSIEGVHGSASPPARLTLPSAALAAVHGVVVDCHTHSAFIVNCPAAWNPSLVPSSMLANPFAVKWFTPLWWLRLGDHGSPSARFDRSIKSGGPFLAELCACEFGPLRLDQAHELVALAAVRDPPRGERLAARWL